VGGYNPDKWTLKNRGYVKCENAFIFSLRDKGNKSLIKIVPNTNGKRYAVYDSSNCFPFFSQVLCMGTGEDFSEAYTSAHEWHNTIDKKYQPARNSSSLFSGIDKHDLTITDIEVFGRF